MRTIFMTVTLLLGAVGALGGFERELDFTHDPGLTLEGPDAPARIDWDRDDPPAYPGDAAGSLRVIYDAQAPTARALLPLGRVLDGGAPFRLEADLVIETLDASPADFHAIAFGLSNTSTTGTNRTGTFPVFGDADVFDHLEVSYFPNVTAFGGPTLTPSVFGGEVAGGDAFWNFAALFGPAADLGDNGPGQITRLPVASPVRLALEYDPCTAEIRLEVFDLSTGTPLALDAGLVSLNLGFLLASEPFEVDALSVSAFRDHADFDPSTPALFAVVRYHRLSLQAEPLGARATPRTWQRGRGGDLIVHLREAAEAVRVDVGAGSLPADPVDRRGRTWRVGGGDFEAAAQAAVAADGTVPLVIRSGCRSASDRIRWLD